MKHFLTFGSYFFHPIWLPLAGVLYYFLSTTGLYTSEFVIAQILATATLTIFLPMSFLFTLKKFKIISSYQMPKAKERRLPVLFFTSIAAFMVNFVFGAEKAQVLFYFFSGIFFTGIMACLLTFINFKVSLHMSAIIGLTFFMVAYMYHFYQLDLLIIAGLIFGIGWVASSRLHLRAHSYFELIIGALIGALPQLYFFNLIF
ncbi:hypothetical protein [Psychroflexus planctonicus]|uniref:PAP2 superfamily protein n=1 Tax=Psychroflexus planctonicus TaxID=1526575 RepID=A0ABQ1SDR4_9FLAO|nr:hypothetical protein [Psychroflexus planctonicus]GGE25081.1 hypothetical protein GCM10010832_02300 [Psychroflexus planctonicus]